MSGRTGLARGPLNSIFTLLVCLILTTACDEKSPTGPTVPVGEQFVLARGEGASIAGTMVQVRFEEVANDSRCPIDAICIQAGDAVVVIEVIDQTGSSSYQLTINEPGRKSVTHRNIRIEAIELQPYPMSGRPTDPAAYRATFRVTRS
jgi:hypothetical protein